MLRKAKRFFNTSGPNNPAQHYTLKREGLIVKGLELVKNERYFTIWAPRQTGKSTYLNVLSGQSKKLDYRVAHINVENYKEAPRSAFFNYLYRVIAECWGITLKNKNFGDFQDGIAKIKEEKCVLIVDEVEGLNQEYFGQFLHSIRNLYHFRNEHCLKNVILVGVSNIVGVVEDNASPFNIADNLDVPYFTAEETSELLGMHETETGQVFSQELKEKMIEMTANQPG